MARPRFEDWAGLKRIGRYLKGAPRAVIRYAWQELPECLDVCTDTDFAGCVESRKSTSGGVVYHGRHVIKFWSTTQSTIALSSAEAELYGIVKGAAQGLGIQAVLAEARAPRRLRVHSDASAAIGIVRRAGLGKVRHLHVQELWIQDAVATGRLEVVKIDGKENPADGLTKHLGAADLAAHCRSVEMTISTDRAGLAPRTARGMDGSEGTAASSAPRGTGRGGATVNSAVMSDDLGATGAGAATTHSVEGTRPCWPWEQGAGTGHKMPPAGCEGRYATTCMARHRQEVDGTPYEHARVAFSTPWLAHAPCRVSSGCSHEACGTQGGV